MVIFLYMLHERERGAKLAVKLLKTVPRDWQPTAPRRAILGKGGDNHVSARPD